MKFSLQYIINKILYTVTAAWLLIILGSQLSCAQGTNKFIRKGNKLYEKQQFTDAEAEYKKALSRDSVSSTGLFNLGNSLYKQKRYKEALEQYAASTKQATGNSDKSAANYNIGNTFMANKKWQNAIKAYEQSLLKNPKDNQARYNLAYAQKMLKKQKKGGGGKNNKQKNKDQEKQNKSQNQQNKNQQNKNKQNQQNKEDQQKNKDQQQQHPKPQPSKISKQRAEQLLNAAAQAEKKLHEKKDEKKKGVRVYNGKNW